MATVRLGKAHQLYLRQLAQEMREARREAVRFDKEWNELNQAMNAKHEEENRRRVARGAPPLTAMNIAEAKSTSLAMQDAFGAGQWWMGKAQYLSGLILAEKALVEMLEGGSPWECPR